FDFYDETRLAGFRGFALQRAERFDEARVALEGVVARASRLNPKQTTVALVDLAVVHMAAGDPDEGCSLALMAADKLSRAPYATGIDRLRVFWSGLGDHHSSAARLLAERLSDLP
ncbi:MAG: hypothetical protein JWR52_1053, partial [Marmoricola sp.]|nr:hypothetical protein [Marmoricola sp.]